MRPIPAVIALVILILLALGACSRSMDDEAAGVSSPQTSRQAVNPDQAMAELFDLIRAQKADLGRMRSLLAQGLDINAIYHDQRLITEAAAALKPEVIRLLIEHGADVNAQDGRGNTALSYAVENNNLEIVMMLLDRKADVNIRNADNISPMIKSGPYANIDLTRALLLSGANISDQDAHGNSVLTEAMATNGEESFVKYIRFLITNGVDASGNNGGHALDTLICNIVGTDDDAFAKVIRPVLAMLREAKANFAYQDAYGSSPLHCIGDNTSKLTRYLVANGANPNAVNKDGVTPLMLVSGKAYDNEGSMSWMNSPGMLENLGALLELGARTDLQDNAGRTAMAIAKESGNTEGLRLLERAKR